MSKDTVWGIVIGAVVTFGASALFFGLGNKKKEPVYTILNSSSLIYDSDNSSPKIKVLLEDSVPIRENVYVTTIAVWNKGKLGILKEDVRKPFYIFCSDSIGRLLDSKIIQQNDPEDSNFRLTQVGDSLKIDWDYFDSKYGCNIQIIYLGNNETEILLTGKIEGGSVKEVKSTTENSKLTIVSSIIIIVLMGLIVVNVSTLLFNPKASSRGKIRMILLFIASLIMAVAYFLMIKPFGGSPIPF